MNKNIASVFILLSSVTLPAWAEETNGEGLWTGEVALGYLQSSGNTQTSNFTGKSKAIRESAVWRNTFKLEGANESTEEIRTAENYFGSLKGDYKFDDSSYVFGLFEYTDDRFTGFDYEHTTTVGYGRVLIDNAAHKLSAEVGPGYRYSEYEDGTNEEDAVLHVGALYKWNINENTVFDEEFTSEVGEGKHISKSSTRLQVKVNGNLWGFIAYDIKRTSEVPPDVKNSDRKTSVGLNYAF